MVGVNGGRIISRTDIPHPPVVNMSIENVILLSYRFLHLRNNNDLMMLILAPGKKL